MHRTLVVLPEDPLEAIRYASAVAVLAASARCISLVSPDPWQPLFASVLGVDEGVDQWPPGPFLSKFAGQETILFDSSLETLLAAYRNRIPARHAFGGWFHSLFASTVSRPTSPGDPTSLLAALHLPASETSYPQFQISGEQMQAGRERLARARVRGKVKIGWVVGSLKADRKQFHWKKSLEQLRALRKAQPGWEWVLLTLDENLWSAVQLHEKLGRHLSVIGPDLRPQEWPGVLAALDLVVGGEPFLLNLAAASGTAVLVPSGSRELAANGPHGPGCRMAVRDLVEEIGQLDF